MGMVALIPADIPAKGDAPLPSKARKMHNDYLSDRGGRRAAAMYTLIGTAKLNDLDPQAWLADVLERIADQPVRRLHELLPWNWQPSTTTPSA